MAQSALSRRGLAWVLRHRWTAIAAALIAGAMSFGQGAQAQQAVFRVVLLGTGTPAPSLDRLGPSTLVEAGAEKLIFDVGRGVYVRLNQLGVPFSDVTGCSRTFIPIMSPGCQICG